MVKPAKKETTKYANIRFILLSVDNFAFRPPFKQKQKKTNTVAVLNCVSLEDEVGRIICGCTTNARLF